MKTNESVAASTEVANGMCGITEDMTNRMTPVVLAAAVVGTKPGHTELTVIGRGASRR